MRRGIYLFEHRCPPKSRSSLLPCFTQIQHSSLIDPSLQLTARFLPNQFLSRPFSVPLSAYPFLCILFFFFHFSHYHSWPPTPSPIPPIVLPHTLRSSGSLPPRWFVNSSLQRNRYFINKPQGAFVLILYDLCGKGLRVSISFSGPFPKLCC